MLANEIKEGRVGYLNNGWRFTMRDNMRGVVRVAEVEGFFTETGSIYMHDIDYVINDEGEPEAVEFTPAQQKQIAQIKEGLSVFGG